MSRRFKLTNADGNLKDENGYNNTIVSMKYYFDRILNIHTIYLVSIPEEKQSKQYYTLHSVSFKNDQLESLIH